MLSIYLSLALSLSRVPGSTTEDSGLYLCYTSINGDVCESEGVAAYVTYTDPPTRPSTFYPISSSEWNFNEANILKYLNVSSSDAPNVSAKFSGVLTPNETDIYTFSLLARHSSSVDTCSFRIGANDLFIYIDLSYSGTGGSYSLGCSVSRVIDTAPCIQYSYCEAEYYLVAGEQYPIYAGARSNYTIQQTDNLWLGLTYWGSSSYDPTMTNGVVVGLSKDPESEDVISSSKISDPESEDVISSKKISVGLIGGVCAGIVFVVAIASVAAWFIIRKVTKKDKPSNSDVVDRREHGDGYLQRINGIGVKEGGSRQGSGRSSQHDSHTINVHVGLRRKEHRGRKAKRSGQSV